ncbi:MAG: hypothetical protein ABFD92_03320 [Planctomycetaceae bacterium]|nr:hypothetical protein [Planctomycetaceae bacterium]
MAESIETFVAKLQSEGVEAGQHQAQQIVQAANEQAAKIVEDARRQGQQIVDQANTAAAASLDRAKTQLELACRDAALKLHEAVVRAAKLVLVDATASELDDPRLVGQLLHEIVLSYVKAEQEGNPWLLINVKPEMRDRLRDWALKEIGRGAVDQLRGHFDISATLAQSGFEFTVHGATVEVTADSVADALAQLVAPALRETLRKVMKETD